MKNIYEGYTDKSLVGIYIFNYSDDPKKREALYEELERRGLVDWARQTFFELYDIFDKKFVEREKGIEGEEAREGD